MKKIVLLSFCFLSLFTGCEETLVEEPYSELAVSTFLSSREGVESVLFASYSQTANMFGYVDNDRYAVQEMCTDILTHIGGGEHGRSIGIIEFTWDPSHGYFPSLYSTPYAAINNANTVIDNIGVLEESDEYKNEINAEARFLRAINYYYLWDLFGPVPLRTSTTDPLQMARPNEEEFISFIETELLATVGDLPNPGDEEAYGRANKGAAWAFLCKFYLNTKQWQKCVEAADEVIATNHYQLLPNYEDLFKVENDGNREMIWVRPANIASEDVGNRFIAVSTPNNFQSDPDSGIKWQSNWANFASDYLLYDSFVNSFDLNDDRRKLILTRYIDRDGNEIQMLGNDASMSWKYRPDPNANGQDHGNDKVVIRYADILLSKAEALNEINGPNPESIGLINDIRARANISLINAADFASKETLKDEIVLERSWEFYSEEKRRRDLIRTGKFIEYAHDRGYNQVDEHHMLYPIPQFAMDSNPLLQQNPGY